MNKQLKTMWLEALRSRKYQQGQGFLRRNDKFCSLGVLLDAWDNSNWVKIDNLKGEYAYGGNTSFIDYNLRTQSGLSFGQVLLLTRLNDSGKSFDYIANVIDKQF